MGHRQGRPCARECEIEIINSAPDSDTTRAGALCDIAGEVAAGERSLAQVGIVVGAGQLVRQDGGSSGQFYGAQPLQLTQTCAPTGERLRIVNGATNTRTEAAGGVAGEMATSDHQRPAVVQDCPAGSAAAVRHTAQGTQTKGLFHGFGCR